MKREKERKRELELKNSLEAAYVKLDKRLKHISRNSNIDAQC